MMHSTPESTPCLPEKVVRRDACISMHVLLKFVSFVTRVFCRAQGDNAKTGSDGRAGSTYHPLADLVVKLVVQVTTALQCVSAVVAW